MYTHILFSLIILLYHKANIQGASHLKFQVQGYSVKQICTSG